MNRKKYFVYRPGLQKEANSSQQTPADYEKAKAEDEAIARVEEQVRLEEEAKLKEEKAKAEANKKHLENALLGALGGGSIGAGIGAGIDIKRKGALGSGTLYGAGIGALSGGAALPVLLWYVNKKKQEQARKNVVVV